MTPSALQRYADTIAHARSNGDAAMARKLCDELKDAALAHIALERPTDAHLLAGEVLKVVGVQD